MQHLVKTVFKSGSLYSKQNFHFLTTIGADSIKVKIAEKKIMPLLVAESLTFYKIVIF